MKNFLLAAMLAFTGCAPAHAYPVRASWYSMGHHTANGERYFPNGRTAAHRSLPFGTVLCVTYHGKTTKVRINDRGPHKKTGRSLDLSRGAAQAIGMIGAGVATVHIQGCKK